MEPFEQGDFCRITDGGQTTVSVPEDLGCRIDRNIILNIKQFALAAIYIRLHHGHLILGQGTGLVGTYDRRRTHRLACMKLSHQIILLEHPAHAESQAHCHAHRQSLRNRHHDKSNRNHYGSKDELCYLHEAHAV